MTLSTERDTTTDTDNTLARSQWVLPTPNSALPENGHRKRNKVKQVAKRGLDTKEVATWESRARTRDETRHVTGVEKAYGHSRRTASKVDVATDLSGQEVITDALWKNEAQEIERVNLVRTNFVVAKTLRETR